MRVAIVAKRLARTGGSERQVLMLTEALASQGIQVHLFCRSVRSTPPPGVHIHRMPPLPLGRTCGLLAFSAWSRRAVARRGPFDVTHAFGRTLGQEVYRLGGGCHRTYLEHAHALDRPPWLRPLLRALPHQVIKARIEESALRAGTTRAILTNSKMTRDDLVFRYGLDAARFHVVRNGVDLSRFRPAGESLRASLRHALGLSPTDSVLLFLGTGYARKGLEPTLRALARLAPTRPRLRLAVVGADRRLAHWKRIARGLGVAQRTVFLGPRPDPERIYPAADVYVLPSAYDPAANSTLEALACGIPVVTTSMNGAGEILLEDQHGTVVRSPVHPQDLADALAPWLDTPDRAAAQARTRELAECYPFEGACRRTLEIYASLADVSDPDRRP